tara:strand:+ start:1492 stop:5700 length:4209 start_codon:yes stop_codon:yes gene_type:complete
MEISKLMLAMMAASSLTLTACGGSSSSSNNQQDTDTGSDSIYLSGTAATGLAIDGTLFVYDAEGRSTNVVIDDDGTFNVNVDGMTPPFMLEAHPDNSSLAIQYSFAEAADITVNVTPLTTLALFLANDQQSLEALRAAWDDEAESFDAAALADAEEVILANFAEQFEEQGIDPNTYDLFNAAFSADQTGFDAVLDDVKIVFDMDGGSFDVDVDEADYSFDETAELDDDNTDGETDTTPDSFSFTASANAEPLTRAESNTVTLSGFDSELALSVSNGSLILNGTATASPAQVSAGDEIQVFHTSSSDFGSAVTSTVTLGSVTADFTSTTRAADVTPDNISFTAQTDVELSTGVTSTLVALTGFEGTLPLSVTNGSLLVNNSASGTSATVSAGDQIQIVQTSSSNFSTSVTSTVTLGSVTTDFTSTTRAADNTPNSISFTSQSDLALGEGTFSNQVTVGGFDGDATVTISNGQFQVNGGAWMTSGTISAGDTLRLYQEQPEGFEETKVTTVTINGEAFTFTTTTRAADTTPDSFTFAAQANVEPSGVIQSSAITLAGFEAAMTMSVGNGTLIVNGTAAGTSAQVEAGDQVAVSHTSSADFDTSATSTVTLGSVNATFTSTTRAADTTPDSFSFSAQTDVEPATRINSNIVTITGFEEQLPLTVTNGSFLVNGSVAGSSTQVVDGDQIQVVHTSSSDFSTQVTSTVTLGSVTADFTSTTRTADTIPNSFSFTDQTDVEPSTSINSDPVTLSNFEGELTMSVDTGFLLVNGAPSGTSTQVEAGDQIQVSHVSSSELETDVTSTVTLGNLTADFTSTTRVADTTPDAVVFNPVQNASRNWYIYSNAVTLTGFDGDANINISNGHYELDGSNNWGNGSASVPAGTQVKLRATTSNSYGATTDVTLTVNGTPFAFSVTTQAAPTPALGSPFSHYIDGQIVDPGYVSTSYEQWQNAKDRVPQNVLIEVRYDVDSAVQGTPINVYNGEYSIGYSGVWHQGTATSETDIGNYSHTVTSSETIKVRHTSGSSDRETVETTLIIGGAMGAGIDTASFSTRTYDVDFFKIPVIDSTWSIGVDDVAGLAIPQGYEQADITDDFPIYTLKSSSMGSGTGNTTSLMKAQMTSNSGTIDQANVTSYSGVSLTADITAVKISETEDLLVYCNQAISPARLSLAPSSQVTDVVDISLNINDGTTYWRLNSCQDVAITDVTRASGSVSFKAFVGGTGTDGSNTNLYQVATAYVSFDTSTSGSLSNKVSITNKVLFTEIDTSNNRTVLAMSAIDSNNVVYAVSQPNEVMWGTSALYLYKGDTGSTHQLIGSDVEPFNNWNTIWTVDDIFVWNKPGDPQIYLVSGNRGVIRVDAGNRNLSNYSVLSAGSTCIDGVTGIPNDSKITLYCHDRDGDPSHILNFDDQ